MNALSHNRKHNMHIMASMIGSVQLRPGTFPGLLRQRAPMNRSRWTRGPQTRTQASVKDSVKDTYTDVGSKKFDLNDTTYRKGGMESEKVDGPVTRLWKFFFRPNEGYVDRFGFSVPMGPLDDVSTSMLLSAQSVHSKRVTSRYDFHIDPHTCVELLHAYACTSGLSQRLLHL